MYYQISVFKGPRFIDGFDADTWHEALERIREHEALGCEVIVDKVVNAEVYTTEGGITGKEERDA